MTRGSDLKRFNNRYFYNQDFVNMQLFDSQYVRKLLSVYKLVKSNLLFSDVVRITNKHVENSQPKHRWLVTTLVS